jgi:thymidylate synthase ThyX
MSTTNDEHGAGNHALDVKALRPFLTDADAEIYCIRDLPEEVVSVLFAYVSRSPRSFRENLVTLLGEEGIASPADVDGFDPASEKAARFHKKWVIGYGHASVAEHSVLHYGIERLSILATKVLEDNRLAAFTEKSTRYQYFGRDTFYRDPALWSGPHADACEAGMNHLMDSYREVFEHVGAHLRAKHPPKPDVKPRLYEAALHAQVCDASRYLLPLATETMVAVTINARSAAWAISKLLSHPAEEMRVLGARMREEGLKICPTLLRHAEANAFQGALRDEATAYLDAELPGAPDKSETMETSGPGNGARLLRVDEDALDHVVAGLLAEHGPEGIEAISRRLASQTEAMKLALLERVHAAMGPHDQCPRAFERSNYSFELTVDYGAFRDIQRHRMATQINPTLTPALGYETPEEILEAGCGALYDEAMERAGSLFDAVAITHPVQAQYLLPLAYRKRVVFDWNLRELAHFVKLRSAAQGHISYRRIAWQIRDLVVEAQPWTAPFLPVDRERYPLGRLEAYGQTS